MLAGHRKSTGVDWPSHWLSHWLCMTHAGKPAPASKQTSQSTRAGSWEVQRAVWACVFHTIRHMIPVYLFDQTLGSDYTQKTPELYREGIQPSAKTQVTTQGGLCAPRRTRSPQELEAQPAAGEAVRERWPFRTALELDAPQLHRVKAQQVFLQMCFHRKLLQYTRYGFSGSCPMFVCRKHLYISVWGFTTPQRLLLLQEK